MSQIAVEYLQLMMMMVMTWLMLAIIRSITDLKEATERKRLKIHFGTLKDDDGIFFLPSK